MHERTRRIFCRAGFVLFCLLPTSVVSSLVIYRHTDRHAQAMREHWQAALATVLQADVSIGTVRQPNYRYVVLDDVQVQQLETGDLVAAAGALEVAHTDAGLVVLAHHLEVVDEKLPLLVKLIDAGVLQRASPGAPSFRMAASSLTIHGGTTGQTFANLRIQLQSAAGGPSLLLSAHAPDRPEESIRIMASRNRQVSPPLTRWELSTGEASVPCQLFARALPALNRLGTSCRFQGLAWLDASDQPQGGVQGRLTEVDLQQSFHDFPHTLQGHAELVLQEAVLDGGRLVAAAGSLHARQGSTSASLLLAAEQTLGLTLNERVPRDASSILRFQHLAFAFHIDERGLAVAGSSDPRFPGLVMSDEKGPLLSRTPGSAETVPVVAFVRMLAPDSAIQVPASRQTDWLLQALPTPPLQPTRMVESPAPRTTLRLQE